jgi:ferrous iron transport protein A
MRTLADLKPGETATVHHINDADIGQKLMEMGCLPGCSVRLSNVAPLGCPLCLQIDHSLLTIRREAAAQVVIY